MNGERLFALDGVIAGSRLVRQALPKLVLEILREAVQTAVEPLKEGPSLRLDDIPVNICRASGCLSSPCTSQSNKPWRQRECPKSDYIEVAARRINGPKVGRERAGHAPGIFFYHALLVTF